MLSHLLTNMQVKEVRMSCTNHVRPGLISDWKSQTSMGFQAGREPAVLGDHSIGWNGFETEEKLPDKRDSQIATEVLVATNGVSKKKKRFSKLLESRLTPTSRILQASNDAAQSSGRVCDRCSLGPRSKLNLADQLQVHPKE